MRFLLGACILPILFGTSPSLANERAYSLSFQSGYEISGFRGNGFEHSDFTKISVEGSSHSYRHREVNRGLRIRNT